MFFALYDRFFKTIGKTYILESWSRTQRAVDFDELNIVGEQIPYSADPFFVVVNDKQGKMMFSGLASTPVIDEKTKKTSIALKDYTTLFNTEIIVDWSKFSGTTVGEYIEFILSTWLNQTDVGFATIKWDASPLKTISLDKEIEFGEGVENIFLYTLILDVFRYYETYCDCKLDIFNKTLTYYFKKSFTNKRSVRLRDFGIYSIEKSFGDYNRATVYSSNFVKKQEWALTEDNNVVKMPTEKNIIYPAKNRNFIAEEPREDLTETQAINDAVYDSVMGLASNRYQETINFDAQKYKSILDLTSLDFSYSLSVYTEDGYYKDLPVGEIETDSKGKHIVRIGYRVQELTQEL